MTRVSWARLAWAWGPSTGLVACALASRRCAPWGWWEGVTGGVPRAVVKALSLPRLPVLWAGGRGPLPTCLGRGCAGVGAQHCPLGLHALLGAACREGGGGPSRGGWPSIVVRGVWCQALSLPRPPVIWGGRPGFRDPCILGAVVVGVGTHHRSCGVRSCEPSWRALGVVGGRHLGVPRAVVKAVSLPRLPVLRVGGRGPLPMCRGRGCAGVGAQHCPLGLHALWGAACRGGGGGPSQGGVAFQRCEGCLVSGAVPPPAARLLGRAARIPRPVFPGRGGCGRGDPAPVPQRALLRAVVALCGGGGRASPRDAGSNSHEFARIRIRPEFARIRGPLRTRIRNFKLESSLIRLIESIGTYNLPSRLQFTCLHMGMPLPSTISHKRFPKSFRNLAFFVVCCCLHSPC